MEIIKKCHQHCRSSICRGGLITRGSRHIRHSLNTFEFLDEHEVQIQLPSSGVVFDCEDGDTDFFAILLPNVIFLLLFVTVGDDGAKASGTSWLTGGVGTRYGPTQIHFQLSVLKANIKVREIRVIDYTT
jgi:hypothetical protein